MTIPYAVTDTKHGVICEELADGGVHITIPSALARWRLAAGWPEGRLGRLLSRLFSLARPRALIRLSRRSIAIVEWGHTDNGPRRTKIRGRREQIEALRLNRFSNSLYLRIRGEIDVDLLSDLPHSLIVAVSADLEAAMARLARSTGSGQAGSDKSCGAAEEK